MTDGERIDDERLIIFDCDGVLVDSEAVVIEIEAKLLSDAGFTLTADEIAETFVGMSYVDMMAIIAERFGRPVPDSLSKTIQQDALAAFPSRLQAVAGIKDVLAASTAPRCIASSSDLDRIRLSLDVTDLATLFEEESVFSAQMVERGKPEPDLFLHAAKQMGFDPADCVVVEDSPHGVHAAVAANMAVIGFTAGAHVRPSLVGRLVDAGADAVASNATELLAALDSVGR